MPFQPGQSGNPAGRPRGARNKTSVLIEQLLEGDAGAIVCKMIDQAKAGNARALGLLAPAILPKRKDAVIELDLPPLEQAADAPRAIATIIAAVCAGEISPQEGMSLTRMVEAYARAKQKTDGVRPAREKADVAAAVRESVEPHRAHESQPPSPVRPREEAHPPSPAHPPSVNAPAPEAWHSILPASGGCSPARLREQALSSTSPLAQSATRPPIVSPLLSPCAAPAAPDRMRAAA